MLLNVFNASASLKAATIVLALLTLPASAIADSGLAQIIDVVDVAGRTVGVKRGVERVNLGEGRMMYSVAEPDRDDPFQRIISVHRFSASLAERTI